MNIFQGDLTDTSAMALSKLFIGICKRLCSSDRDNGKGNVVQLAAVTEVTVLRV